MRKHGKKYREQAAKVAPIRRAAEEVADVARSRLKRAKDAAASGKGTLDDVEAASLAVMEAEGVKVSFGFGGEYGAGFVRRPSELDDRILQQ